MKNKVLLTAIAIFFTTGMLFAAEGKSYNVDNAKSEVKWKGEKVTGEHYGKVKIKSGSLEMKDGMLVGGTFVMDMTSIICEDLTDEGTNKKLVGHLKSDDFFGVKDHPTSKLVIKQVVPQGPGKYKIIADITIKGITKEIKFNANVKSSGDSVNATAEIVIDRSEFNVRYGSGSFFDDLGDKTIYDEFTMTVSLTAKA